MQVHNVTFSFLT